MATTNGSGNRDFFDRIARRSPRRWSEEALARREGIVARKAQLRARVDLARELGDPVEERAAARDLAALLAAREAELDVAVELAFRSLASHEDVPLRHALAGWLEGLGEPALAASELRKAAAASSGVHAAAVLVHIGVLHARADDPVGAQEAFTEAAELDETDALALELLGAVASWVTAKGGAGSGALDDDGFPGPRAGAEAYVRAARRRAERGDLDGELDDLLRAFELDRSSPLAAAALVSAYTARSRKGAADFALSLHAEALRAADEAARAEGRVVTVDAVTAAHVHARRRATALEEGDLGRAFDAALAERLDMVFSGPGAEAFDDLLARAGAYEPLALRLEVRAERERGRGAAARWLELGRLLSGPLASPERAAMAFARAVAADASNGDAVHALTALSDRTGDTAWLVEALVRATLGAAAHGALEDNAARLAAARALVSISERASDPLLMAFASRVVGELDPSNERARASVARLASTVARREEELAHARRALTSASGDARVPALRAVVELARGLPDASRELSAALVELAELRSRAAVEPGAPEDPLFAEALRVAERVGDFAAVARLARARLEARGASVRVRGVLVGALRQVGDIPGAAREARVFAADTTTRWTCSVAWVTAALAGDDATRALALAAVAPACGAKAGAAISAYAADALASAGELEAARRAAEQACRGDGQHVRALALLARLTMHAEPRVARAAIEQAIEAAGASSAWCRLLADVCDRLGDQRAAVAWARRWVSLRPGDADAVATLLERATRAGDGEALADALGWLVPQPGPTRDLAERLAPALEALGALDPARAAATARRALDVFGPRNARLRAAIDAVAVAARDERLRAVVAERWIAAGAPATERGRLLLDLAARYEQLGDVEAELDAYARAVRARMQLAPRSARIDALARAPKSPDGEIALLEVVAELRLEQGDTLRARRALRELGAALWDTADDRPRAVQAWLRAARCAGTASCFEKLRGDLTTFAGAQYALDCLAELVDREPDRVRSGTLATQAARAAIDASAATRALALAKVALERAPGLTRALETAETACVELERVAEMAPLYERVARSARGRFGRRAAHHRAARFFESGGMAMLALKHAAQAFIAVPSEGTTLTLLQRTAVNARREGVAVRTLEHVAELSRGAGARAAWLLRAATMTPETVEGERQKLDLLLKAAVVVPAPATVDMLAGAARRLIDLAPEDREAIALRLERASEQLSRTLEGPDGARIAITFVEMAITPFGDPEWAWRSLRQAVTADADVDEYLRLVPHGSALAAGARGDAGLSEVVAELDKPYANVGGALLRLVGAVAESAGDAELRAKVLVRAATLAPEDDAVVASAEEAIAVHPDPTLTARLSSTVDEARRTEALRRAAEASLLAGDVDAAVRLLERARAIAPAEHQAAVTAALREALFAAGRGEDLLLRELSDDALSGGERAAIWAEVARVRRERGEATGAGDALVQAALEEPTPARWAAVEEIAESTGRERLRVDALRHLVDLARRGEGGDVKSTLKRLARAEGARGSLAAAEAAWREVMALDPSDPEADVAIEALLAARGSFEELAAHLAERAGRLAGSASLEDRAKLRAVRLRRAAVLEERLARYGEACAELEQVLAEEPSHLQALRWIADLYERAGEPAKALPALERLFAGATEELAYVDLGVRRARALVASGALREAQAAVRDLQARAPGILAVTEARVEVARATQDAAELGEALADLARTMPDEPLARSEVLVEAAQAAARAGNIDVSLARAREAAELAPTVPATQLFARGLEYRLRGAGTRDEALETIAVLERFGGTDGAEQLEPEDVALRAFLLAEAEVVVHGPRAGEDTLRRCLAELGPLPLVALGLAERAASAGRHDEALRFYTEAMAGSLLGLRNLGRVAMAAASSATHAGDAAAAAQFLSVAVNDPETRSEALERAAAGGARPSDAAAPDATGPGAPARPPSGEIPAAANEPSPARRTEGEPLLSVQALPFGAVAPPTDARVAAKVAEARAELGRGSRERAERLLTEALGEGALEAADTLDELLRDDPARRDALVKVRRQAVELDPGDVERLTALREAALADQNTNWARAIDHVLRALVPGAAPLEPPPLGAQSVQPGIHALLTAPSREPAGEAYGVVWQEAPAVFARSAATPRDLERIVPGAGSALSLVYEAALRLLDTPRCALFQERPPPVRRGDAYVEGDGRLSVALALGPPAAAIISGAAGSDTPELRWALGEALSAVLPQNTLVLGLEPPAARALWEVLLGAFGPPGLVSIGRAHADLADMLWQTLTPRAQRQLQDLLAASEGIAFERVLEHAKQSGRRLGMFLTGDFAHALSATLAETGAAEERTAALGEPKGLARICQEVPAVADLLRLAVRPEYADARWCVPGAASQRRISGRLPRV